MTNVKKILNGFARLAAHEDVKPALLKLREQGFKTVAFSHSSSELIAKQLESAELIYDFDEVISVEQTGSFKPDLAVYRFAADKLGVATDQLRLVATHDWDTHGALTAGLKAAYIAHSNAPYHALYHLGAYSLFP